MTKPRSITAVFTDQQYELSNTGLVWLKPTRKKGFVTGSVRVPLANFNALVIDAFYLTRATGERVAMWKIEAQVMSTQEGPMRGRKPPTQTVTIPAKSFNGMRWVIEKLGLHFIVHAGRNRRAAEAIMMLSPVLNP